MFGSRTAFGVGCCALLLAPACGGSVAHSGPEESLGGAAQGGSPVSRAGAAAGGSTSSAGKPSFGGNAGAPAQGGSAGEPEPIDSGCLVQEPTPPPDLQCDAFDVASCGPGGGCYPFVEHPQGSGCGQQRYGTTCLPAGQGTQGELCGSGDLDGCAPGLVCVVGQQAGKRCAALCRLGQPNQCSGGLICGELDVAGFGVCG